MPIVTFERWGRNALSKWIGRAFPLAKLSAPALRAEWEAGKIRKIVFIRPHQGLGDLLLATPVFRALKSARPDVQLHFVADSYNHPAVKNNPDLDRIFVWRKK